MKNREKVDLSKKIKSFFLALIMLSIVLIFTGMILFYFNKFEKALIEENSNHLSEIAQHITINMQTVVQDTTKALEAVGNSIFSLKEEERMVYLEEMKQKYDFDYIGYAREDGQLIATMESESKDISTQKYFQEAFTGESVIEYMPRKIFIDRAISGILIAVPMYEIGEDNGVPIGVLVAMLDLQNLNKVMGIGSFGGEGYTYIIDMKGEIVLSTKRTGYGNLYTALKNTQFEKKYSIDKMIFDISSQKQGFAIYSHFGVEKYVYYKYLGIDSWSVVTTVEKNVITGKTTKLIKGMSTVGIIIIILFSGLVVFAILSYGISNNHKEAARAKTAFLANMSHEIRTPMNAIIGISEILLRENITGKQKNYVLSIVNAGNGLLTIINDILDISKIESGKFSITEEEYELESLIYDITTIIAIRIGEKPIEFMVDSDPDLPKYVTGDMIRVKQVLLNIIGNAVKFTEKGYIKLGIYARTIDGKLEIVMPVEDTGMGIDKKDLNKLFVSFNQVDTHKNHNLEGTGLGLVISKRLCEMMGGDITVESEYGKGSTFTVVIRQGITRPEKIIYSIKPENFRLLLLEDTTILHEHFSACLDKMKIDYEVCTTYEAFVEKIEIGSYTHILAKYKVIQQLVKEGYNKGNTHFVTLLSLKQQSLLENHRLNIYIPLFTIQLAAVLYNKTEHAYLLKRTGIDLLAIHPMPFVKVLIVDDNEVNIQVANGLMNPYHMQVDCAFSGKSAIEMINQNEYDLVFMDHMMPEMDGVEATKIIRTLPNVEKSKIPIVALTANITQDARQLFLEVGFDDFLAKPIETVKLNAILKKWLRNKNDLRAKENPEKAKAFQKKLIKLEEKNKKEEMKETIKKDLGSEGYTNFTEGIEKLGSIEVYCNILLTYCRVAKERLKDLSVLLETDIETFKIEVHGLKGASAGISSKIISEMAATLEYLAKENKKEEIQEKLPLFLEKLEESLEEMTLFINAYNKKSEEVLEKDKKEVKKGAFDDKIIMSIEEAFMNYDTENIKVLLEEQEVFDHEETERELLMKLRECYKTYEFERPLELIEAYRGVTNERSES